MSTGYKIANQEGLNVQMQEHLFYSDVARRYAEQGMRLRRMQMRYLMLAGFILDQVSSCPQTSYGLNGIEVCSILFQEDFIIL